MPNIRKETFPRRQFLKGAAATAGVACVGPAAMARAIGRMTTPVAVFVWNDGRFVDASRISSTSEKIDRVRVTVSGSGSGNLQALDALFYVSGRSRTKPAGFRAWLPDSSTTRFEMPVSEREGISFLVTTSNLGRTVKSNIQLGRNGSNLKLREGTYVIVSSGQNLARTRLDESENLVKRSSEHAQPVDFQHLILKVEQVS